MAPLSDRETLEQIREALREWNIEGFVTWKKRAREWIALNLEGHTQRSVGELMYRFVESEGAIDQVRERREPYRDLVDYHYDFRFAVDGRRVYIETILTVTKTGPVLTIVNIHDE